MANLPSFFSVGEIICRDDVSLSRAVAADSPNKSRGKNGAQLSVLACHYNGAAADRFPRPDARFHPYQHRGAEQASSTWDNRQRAGSPDDFSSIASGSQIVPESPDSATSPGADSDPYHSYPNTPGYTSAAISDELEIAQVGGKREFCLRVSEGSLTWARPTFGVL